ncbi:DinB family protein [Pedobacter frigoris]|uniref:DinB family protein n=1 Tax=Pedobacter frigoris TaxID=2571272 RepID=UPI00292E9A9C|nr:DinB family protein [Pedobacter frigoris]
METENIKSLKTSFEELIQILSDLDQQQLNEVPFEGSWTAAQVGDHLFQSYELIDILKENVVPTSRPIDQKVQGIQELFLNFEMKFQSPVSILPYRGVIDKAELLHGLNCRTKQLTDFAESNDLSLTCTAFEFPGFGTLTRLELLIFIDVHTKRHTHQLRNIIACLQPIPYS